MLTCATKFMIKWVRPRSLVNRYERMLLQIAAEKTKSTVDIDRAFFVRKTFAGKVATVPRAPWPRLNYFYSFTQRCVYPAGWFALIGAGDATTLAKPRRVGLQASRCIGSINVKQVPLPTELSTRILPP